MFLAAWNDEEDENYEIDISNVARLRKLRKDNEETKINGVEY